MAGATWEGLGENGVQWPFGADGKGTAVLHTEQFKLGKGRLAFKGFEESPELLENAKAFPFILTTNRDLEHYNCGTMTRRTANAMIHQEDVLWINPEDAAAKGIAEGDWVCVSSARGKVDIRAMITDGVKQGVLSTTFHFPELMINVLTSSVYDTEAKCPEYKVVAVDVRKSRKLEERRGINAGKVTALRK
jgi:formate dehydrogenase major subunit